MPREESGLTDEQLEQTIGTFPINQESTRQRSMAAPQAEAARNGVREAAAETARIAAKYNAIAKRTNRNIRAEVQEDELAADRARLEALIGDEYQFMNPFGNIEGKRRTIDVILNGRILYESYGRGGFETTEESLQVHGDTAVLISAFKMRGSGEARRTDTGEVYEHDLAGTYRTSHTYVRRGGRWQVTASQMTQVPEQADFAFVADEEADYS
jgi:hypothetical protein